ncbi:MAG: thioredoxin [Clostridia bacterium]|nr:thioredoxin [Clostridia bacterium]
MSIVYVTQANFEEEVLKSDKTVLLDFYADWCGPCRMIAPILEEIAREHEEYKICKVNVDEEPALAAKFDVMSIPTLFVLKNGEVVANSMGAKPKAQILAMLA